MVLVVEIISFLKLSLFGKMRDIASMHDIDIMYLNVSVRYDWTLYEIVESHEIIGLALFYFLSDFYSVFAA